MSQQWVKADGLFLHLQFAVFVKQHPDGHFSIRYKPAKKGSRWQGVDKRWLSPMSAKDYAREHLIRSGQCEEMPAYMVRKWLS